MNRLGLLFFLSFLLSLTFAVKAFGDEAEDSTPILTKSAAWEELKRNGARWQETMTLVPEAQAKTLAAQSELSPKVGFAARHFISHIDPSQYGLGPPYNSIQWISFGSTGLEVEAVILDLLARAKLEGAQKSEKINASKAKQFQNDLTAMMLLEFIEVQRLKRELTAVDANLKRDRLIIKLAKAKNAVGAGIPLEVAKANNLIGADNLKRVTLFTRYMKARQNLALIIGKDRLDFEVEPLRYEPMQDDNFEDTLNFSLQNRDDLKIANFTFEAAALARKEAGRSLWPKISAVASGGITGTYPFGISAGDGMSLTGLAGIQLTLPIWSGGLLASKRQEAEVNFTRADLELRQTRLEVLSQVKEVLGLMLNAKEAIRAATEYVDAAKQENDIADKRYYSGASNILELTSAHTNLISATDSQIEAIYSYEKAKVAYFRAISDFNRYFALPSTEKEAR